jgi:hypothetical protein
VVLEALRLPGRKAVCGLRHQARTLRARCRRATDTGRSRQVRKAIKTRGQFPAEQAATKLIYLAKEVERSQRLKLDWSGPQGGRDALWRRIQGDPQLLLDVLRFACENILLGWSFQELRARANECRKLQA